MHRNRALACIVGGCLALALASGTSAHETHPMPVSVENPAPHPAVLQDLNFVTPLSTRDEATPGESRSEGFAFVALREGRSLMRFRAAYPPLRDVTMAHLHLGPEGEDGPVVAGLLPADLSELSRHTRRRLDFEIRGELDADDLVGPLAGQPLDALVAQIEAGNVYVNVHTERFPAGALRGQLRLY